MCLIWYDVMIQPLTVGCQRTDLAKQPSIGSPNNNPRAHVACKRMSLCLVSLTNGESHLGMSLGDFLRDLHMTYNWYIIADWDQLH